jgi:UDP-N-acetylmuramoyl-tripeptide--D-alanyl-D-alanine ligase
MRDLPALLRTPVGRAQFRGGVFYRAWPILARAASLHRSTIGRRARVVAVVGSTGKTTTARAVAAAVGLDPDAVKDNYASFVATALLNIRPRDRHAVLEIGIDGPGQMSRYAHLLRPQIAVVTSIGSDHNRSLHNFEVTRAEKAAMVRALGSGGLAVLNGDDENVRWMSQTTDAEIRTFGFDATNDVRATDVELEWPHGTRFTLHANGGARSVSVRLLGQPMVYPILAAATVALAEGFNLDSALPALEALPPTPGRLQVVPLQNGAFVVRDDFKSTLESFDAALDVLAEIPAERRIVVLGDIDEAPGTQGPIYGRLGERFATIADRAIIVGRRDRYAAGARRQGFRSEDVVEVRDVLEAAEIVRNDVRRGDVILVKGRSTQRLDRVALALTGRTVCCNVRSCDAMLARCERCPMLERGWDGVRVVI